MNILDMKYLKHDQDTFSEDHTTVSCYVQKQSFAGVL